MKPFTKIVLMSVALATAFVSFANFPPRIQEYVPQGAITNQKLLTKKKFYSSGWIEIFSAVDANGIQFVKVRLSNDDRFYSAYLSVSLTCLDTENKKQAWFEKDIGIGLRGRIERTREYIIDCERLEVAWLPHDKKGPKGREILKNIYHTNKLSIKGRLGDRGRVQSR